MSGPRPDAGRGERWPRRPSAPEVPATGASAGQHRRAGAHRHLAPLRRPSRACTMEGERAVRVQPRAHPRTRPWMLDDEAGADDGDLAPPPGAPRAASGSRLGPRQQAGKRLAAAQGVGAGHVHGGSARGRKRRRAAAAPAALRGARPRAGAGNARHTARPRQECDRVWPSVFLSGLQLFPMESALVRGYNEGPPVSRGGGARWRRPSAQRSRVGSPGRWAPWAPDGRERLDPVPGSYHRLGTRLRAQRLGAAGSARLRPGVARLEGRARRVGRMRVPAMSAGPPVPVRWPACGEWVRCVLPSAPGSRRGRWRGRSRWRSP